MQEGNLSINQLESLDDKASEANMFSVNKQNMYTPNISINEKKKSY